MFEVNLFPKTNITKNATDASTKNYVKCIKSIKTSNNESLRSFCVAAVCLEWTLSMDGDWHPKKVFKNTQIFHILHLISTKSNNIIDIVEIFTLY
jgi:hypothetical protein